MALEAVSYMLLRLRSRTGLIYAFSAPASSMSPASVVGLTRGLTGYFGLMRQLLGALCRGTGAHRDGLLLLVAHDRDFDDLPAIAVDGLEPVVAAHGRIG